MNAINVTKSTYVIHAFLLNLGLKHALIIVKFLVLRCAIARLVAASLINLLRHRVLAARH